MGDCDNDAPQLNDSMVGMENSPTNQHSDEVQGGKPEDQPNQDSDKLQHQMSDQPMTVERQSSSNEPTLSESLQLENNRQTSPNEPTLSESLQLEAPNPHPHQGGMSFTSLLTATDDEILDPTREKVPQSHEVRLILESKPPEKNSSSSALQIQLTVIQDGALNTQFYANGNSTGNNKPVIKQNETPKEHNFSVLNLPCLNLPIASSPTSSQSMPQQMQFQPQFSAVSTNPPQTPKGKSTCAPLFSSFQWTNQSYTSQPSLNHISLSRGSPVFPRTPNLQMNHQRRMQRNKMPIASGCLEAGESSSIGQKRNLPLLDDRSLKMPSNQNGDATPAVAYKPPRLRSLIYNPAYEAMGLPIDPHFRVLKEIQEKSDENQEQDK